MSKRDGRILEILTREHKVEVSDLAERLSVSSVTMRKDLDGLQEQGLVMREHGYALLANPNDVAGRLAYHYEAKLRIASRAAEFVSDGDTIMVESGSCCAILVRRIAETKKHVTIVTNSEFIVSYLRDYSSVEVVLLGGNVQRDAQVTVGPFVRLCAEQFLVDNLFIGADGWVDGVGFTNADQMRAEAVRSMAASAGRVVVLTESEKFARYGAVLMRIEKPMAVVTDSDVSPEQRASVERTGVELIIA
ncbi:MAG: DeoR/GlpR family DNA-binding transcription regulator [Coriobacteriaceae bacterium]|uniref:DeoR/GlpR family DNA-binding transcription regulator n=1 Tax=Tractidigestivibacter sp. TaxID=2847320 RepID=UPI002A817FC3|nr:DeoR/GlpR family DNA-binding transcription regulator [Tractidigestivibacter sp.]MCI6275124.1 DeoR/GlpR family DNA-binding transcription regulator [Coriobacteriaceae bacterium]MCI6548010.1 DeoR/GlpR family DNA-binding transcription regulator [Coriobacteriaceae bacterium]MCI6845090.1 DeoR/GlpR family DNA-binding transcription regulator [Coriobacteriaceae bacterium]MCI7438394.1 DeoR/GlpR family DNA-binding transcription regulator [Coriobacteriaceae bacterium]MDD7585240.1 DeoR/GlpR family DNA-b